MQGKRLGFRVSPDEGRHGGIPRNLHMGRVFMAWVWGSELRIQVLGLKVEGYGFRVQGLGFRVKG